jgi:hypothetical protein
MALQKDLKEFIDSLNSNEVEYLVIGAYALAVHGHPRLTGDIDFFVRASCENAERLAAALDEFSGGAIAFAVEEFLQEDRMLRIGVEPHRVDILNRIAGVGFEEAWQQRVVQEFGGVTANFIGRNHLIQNKRATGRLQDLADAEFVEKLDS